MPDQDEFLELILRVRAGDESAATDLVRRIEPFILRVARLQMRQRRSGPLPHDVGSSDVCQSVLASLFKGLKENRFALASPEKLMALLRTMIQFIVLGKARKLSVTRRVLLGPDDHEAVVDSSPGPEQPVIDNDRMIVFLDRLTEDELVLLKRRLDGQPWKQIAAELGEGVEALRKRLERGMERVDTELNDAD